jgi:hypothetical protein
LLLWCLWSSSMLWNQCGEQKVSDCGLLKGFSSCQMKNIYGKFTMHFRALYFLIMNIGSSVMQFWSNTPLPKETNELMQCDRAHSFHISKDESTYDC